MPYYPDLSPYVYQEGFPGHINIGWLDSSRPFERGAVDLKIVAKIGELCFRPENLMRGYQHCTLCEADTTFPTREDYMRDGELRTLGNGEIHVPGPGIYWVYASPTLIYHYILRHAYQPPQEFQDAVLALLSRPEE